MHAVVAFIPASGLRMLPNSPQFDVHYVGETCGQVNPDGYMAFLKQLREGTSFHMNDANEDCVVTFFFTFCTPVSIRQMQRTQLPLAIRGAFGSGADAFAAVYARRQQRGGWHLSVVEHIAAAKGRIAVRQ